MTPLIEVIPPKFMIEKNTIVLKNDSEIRARSRTLIDKLRDSWALRSTFLDFQHLIGVYPREAVGLPIRCMGEHAAALDLNVIPVTGLRRGTHYQSSIASIVRTLGKGACIRLEITDLNDPKLTSKLQKLIKQLGLTPSEMDLIVDYQVLEPETYEDLGHLITVLPIVQGWRSFTVLSGSFPENLKDFSLGSSPWERVEWVQWIKQIDKMHALGRIPTFGDYTIQHGLYKEPIKGGDVSASIRYTSDNEWLVFRGESRKKSGSDQYAAHAVMLQGRPEFKSGSFSYGDKYIDSMCLPSLNPGTPESWLCAGINHHLTFVIDQIANQFGIVIGGAPSPSTPAVQ
jgi:hypothetical protein